LPFGSGWTEYETLSIREKEETDTVVGSLPEKDRRKDRIAGCLLGVAIGDALGAPFEHLPPGETCRLLEKTGGRVLDFHGSWNGPKGGWTDDTCLTLAACQGFLQAARTGGPIPSALHRALRNVGADPGFRKPGKTILNTVLTGFPDVDAWSNGALMRIAPAAVYAVLANASRSQAAHLALFLARLTHGHPLAVFPAVECALALLSIFQGDERVPEDLRDLSALEDFVQEHHRYEEYSEARNRPMRALPPSSGLWMWRLVFEHLLKMTPGRPWSCLPPFEEGLIRVVSDSYDRDTAGAIAGAILGAYWGASAIPERWVAGVERSSDILGMAEEMAEAIKPHENVFHPVMAANTLRTEVYRFPLDPGRIQDSLTARMASLRSRFEQDVASGRLGFALLILPEPSTNAGRLLVLSSPEPVTSFDWKPLNPHLPWETWGEIAGYLEEWKEHPAYTPMAPLISKSRFSFVWSFSSPWENVIWEVVESGLPPMVLLDGRWAEPDGSILCHLEGGPTKEDLPGNRIFRLEERCVQAMERILDGSDLRLDPLEASFLLKAFVSQRAIGNRVTADDLQTVSRFWWTALVLFHAKLHEELAALVDHRSLWEEIARYLAQVPRERLLEVFRVLRSSTYRDARRLALRIGIVLGGDAPWTDMIGFLQDSDPQVRADMLQALDSLDASQVRSFLHAYAGMDGPPASLTGGGRACLKQLLMELMQEADQPTRRSWKKEPYLRASLCRHLLGDTEETVRLSLVAMLQQEDVWRVVARDLLQEPGQEPLLSVLWDSKTESTRRLAARLLAVVGSRAPEETVRGILEDSSGAEEFVRAVRSLKEDQTLWHERVSKPYPAGWFDLLLKSEEESFLIAALDVVEAFSLEETLAEKIMALALPHRPKVALGAAGAIACFPNGIPRAFDIVKYLLREGPKGLGEGIADFLIHRLATEESRVAVSHLLDLLDSGNAPVSEAAAYVLAWAGDESVIPHLKRASRRHRNRRMIQEAQMVLQGKHKELSASMGYFRALHPITRRLIDRARKIHEQKRDQGKDGP